MSVKELWFLLMKITLLLAILWSAVVALWTFSVIWPLTVLSAFIVAGNTAFFARLIVARLKGQFWLGDRWSGSQSHKFFEGW